MDVRDEIKMQSVVLLEMGVEPGKFGAFDWRKALDQMDSVLDQTLPILGPLLPAQVSAIAMLIAKAIDLSAAKTATQS